MSLFRAHEMRGKRVCSAIFLVFALCVSPTMGLMSDQYPVPLALQGIVLSKVFRYDTTLAETEIKVGLVFSESAPTELDELRDSFQAAGVKAFPVSFADLETRAEEVSVVYVFPSTDPEVVRDFCEKHGVLSVSGIPAMAEHGEVSVSLGLVGGKPEIIVHLPRSRSEGHKLSAHLLRLARVIR